MLITAKCNHISLFGHAFSDIIEQLRYV